MTVRFIDGWKHYSAGAQALTKWTSNSTYTQVVNNAGGPTGGGYASCSTARAYWMKTIEAKSEWYLGVRVRWDGGAKQSVFQLWDGTTAQTAVHIDATGHLVALRGASNGTALTGGTSTQVVSSGAWNYVEARFVLSQTTGTVEIRLNGTSILTTSSQDVCGATNATADGVGIATADDIRTGAWTDFYAADNGNSQGFLGDVKVETLYATANSAIQSQQWTASTGSNYTCVNDTTADTTSEDYISTSTAGNIDTFVFGDLSTVSGNIYAVQHNIFARKDDAGSRSIAPVVYPQGDQNRVGTTVSLGDTYADVMEIQTLLPGTANAWTINDVNNAEFGVKLIA